jgi:hypothetical protein
MEYRLASHRNGLFLFENDPSFVADWNAIRVALDSITDDRLIAAHQEARSRRPNCKSLSDAINELLRRGLSDERWERESAIFSDPEYSRRNETRWRLDFASDVMAVEVAFNHGEAIAWNLLKPVLSAELNHIAKARQTRAGIIITATEAMKRAGNFDSAVGTFEKFQRYLNPMMNLLTVPMVIVGLEPPTSFVVGAGGATRGEVIPSSGASLEDLLPLAAEESGQYGEGSG